MPATARQGEPERTQPERALESALAPHQGVAAEVNEPAWLWPQRSMPPGEEMPGNRLNPGLPSPAFMGTGDDPLCPPTLDQED